MNDGEPRDVDRRRRMLDGDMPSTWGGGSGMVREDSGRGGFRREDDRHFRPPRGGDSWVPSRDGRRESSRDRGRFEDERDREQRKRSRSPWSDGIKEGAPEVKYGRR